MSDELNPVTILIFLVVISKSVSLFVNTINSSVIGHPNSLTRLQKSYFILFSITWESLKKKFYLFSSSRHFFFYDNNNESVNPYLNI